MKAASIHLDRAVDGEKCAQFTPISPGSDNCRCGHDLYSHYMCGGPKESRCLRCNAPSQKPEKAAPTDDEINALAAICTFCGNKADHKHAEGGWCCADCCAIWSEAAGNKTLHDWICRVAINFEKEREINALARKIADEAAWNRVVLLSRPWKGWLDVRCLYKSDTVQKYITYLKKRGLLERPDPANPNIVRRKSE